MGYIWGLFLVLAVIFYSLTGNNVFDNVIDYAKEKSSGFLFPKTEKEIIIDNLSKNQGLLERFFSESAPKILGSTNISKEDKESLINAMSSFTKSRSLIKDLEQTIKDEKSLTKAVIQKAVNLFSEPALSPDPTHIPPQCRLECADKPASGFRNENY